ncbi:MAG: cytochrome c4 [Gammaproteobacteria bacterium]|nr:cytochrome c4 [Gammaproteobacteria bacterium]
MKINLAALFTLAVLTLATTQARAQSLVDGSADEGKSKALTCTACHGAEGNSSNPLWPNIAGQHASYTEAQLHAFKNGGRVNALMSAQAMMLSDADMVNLAVYFEGLAGAVQAVADPDLVSRGEALYRGGNSDNGVPACIGCHGPSGRGNPAALYPSLQGQHAAYTAKQLADYASGERKSVGKVQIMAGIASKLSKEDIEALASYVQGLH